MLKLSVTSFGESEIWLVLESQSRKSATFRFDKSAKNVKNNGLKTEKKHFQFAKSTTKVQENVWLQYKIFS